MLFRSSFFFLTICWQQSIVIKSIINYKYVVKTIENYMEELKKKKKNKQTNITFGKILLLYAPKKKKNTNAIYNLIHTHTHTHTYIYIITLDKYYKRIIT